MPQYRVHLYPIMKIEVLIDAPSPQAAADAALAQAMVDMAGGARPEMEYSDEFDDGVVVDDITQDTSRFMYPAGTEPDHWNSGLIL